MVSPKVSIPTITDSPYESPATPKPSQPHLTREDPIDRTSDPKPVYAFTPLLGEKESSLKGSSGGGDAYMSAHGRGGSDQPRAGSSRRQSTQSQSSQQQQPRHYPSLNVPPESPQGYHAPLYNNTSQYAPPRSGYPGQYMMSPHPPHNMAHSPSPPYAYQPFMEQPQSIHAGFPTIASYAPYAQETPAYGATRYPSPMSPGYPNYPPQPMYTQPVYTQTSPYQYQHTQHHSPGGQEGDQGTWWYVPSQQQQQQQQPPPGYDPAGRSSYPFYPPQSPHPDSPQQPHSTYPPSPTYARPSSPSSSSAPSPNPGRESGSGGGGRPLVRRAYHPNPPAHRSEWVMWAGNVPSDAGHDELWRFFTQPPDVGTSASSSSSSSVDSDVVGASGVMSIFLISRSSCAFINYETEATLQAAIARFNGMPLRPADPRCARLVCRVRRKDDDLRAGVGGQRGMGLHRGWVKAKARESPAERTTDEEPGSSSESASTRLSALSVSDDDPHPVSPSDDPPTRGGRPPPRPVDSNSSGSHASGSTSSSLLTRHFPQRFFILKSLTRDDLDLSVRTGVWATQRHNEGVLDRAFRTAQDVFLIFSVNKSGEFYGYARMAGPVGHAESGSRVTWTARSPSGATGGLSPPTARPPLDATTSNPVPLQDDDASAWHAAPRSPLLSDSHLVDHSPAPFPTPSATPLRPPDVQSAPPVLGKPHRAISGENPVLKKYSLDARMALASREAIELDEAAPFRAMRAAPEAEAADAAHEQPVSKGSTSGLKSVAEEPDAREEGGERAEGEQAPGTREESWGQDFKLQWLCMERLPFQRTRHIRNPWNHDREVKVSRDGTELEPGVGQALLEEWRLFLAAEGAAGQTPLSETGSGRAGSRAGGGGGTSRS
ncbi:YT521-B-like domain-containing protein [Mycena maculata]|uniref:YT521-B-like domain-containing protein n=1 Tax=Mycena maculata TaxID=230809 RepID=A0AAD7NP44_9AGAR|nr:YT521-B-like domain-containing protein [Mycena maculata]